MEYVSFIAMCQIRKLQVVIPMVGLGTRFTSYGFRTNKYLLPVNTKGQTMIELAISSLNLHLSNHRYKFFFIINERVDLGEDKELRNILYNISIAYKFDYEIVPYNSSYASTTTDGPATSVYLARDVLDPLQPVLVVNSDQILLRFQIEKFLDKCSLYDGCVYTYKPDYILPEIGQPDKHSFIQLSSDNDQEVIKFAEKVVLSNHALVGIHYFRNANLFLESYQYMVEKNMRAPNGEFYISLCYQSMIELGHKIGYYPLDTSEEYVFPVGEPYDYFHYLYCQGGYKTSHIAKLEPTHTLFSNGASYVQYMNTSKYKIQNPSIILFVSGSAFVPQRDGSYTKLLPFQLTTKDIELDTDCELLLINLHNHNHWKRVYDKFNLILSDNKWIIGPMREQAALAYAKGHLREETKFLDSNGQTLSGVINSDDFELGIFHYSETEERHFYSFQEGFEILVLLKGRMKINGELVTRGHLQLNKARQVVCQEYLDNCSILKIRVGCKIEILY